MKEYEKEIDNDVIESEDVHMGYNVMMLRRTLGLKQLALAQSVGLTRQQEISRIESQPVIKPDLLKKLAVALGVKVEVIRNMPRKSSYTLNIENNTFNSDNGSVQNVSHDGNTTNFDVAEPFEKALSFLKDHFKAERKEKEADREEREKLIKRIIELEELIKKGK